MRGAMLWSLVGCLALLGNVAAYAAFPGRNGRVAYWDTVPDPQHPDDGVNAIFTIRSDGTGRKRLTFRGENDSPRWGPFGHHILYTHGSQIWVMGAHGDHKRQLTRAPRRGADFESAWAPGAHRMVFVRLAGPGRQDLMVYTFATRKIRTLHVGSGFNLIPDEPAWSPDGRLIAFSGLNKTTPGPNDEAQWELFTVRPDGTGLTQITHTPRASEHSPNWSPNGHTLVYQPAISRSDCRLP